MKQTADGLLINIRLTPKAAKNAITGWTTGADGQPLLKASVTAVPEKGKANAALITLLARSWKLPKGSLILIRGETDRNKVLLLNNIHTLPPQAEAP